MTHDACSLLAEVEVVGVLTIYGFPRSNITQLRERQALAAVDRSFAPKVLIFWCRAEQWPNVCMLLHVFVDREVSRLFKVVEMG